MRKQVAKAWLFAFALLDLPTMGIPTFRFTPIIRRVLNRRAG